MDVGFKLEHVLRHLDHTEPDIENWQKMGDSRSSEIEGILVNAGSFENSAEHMLSGLVLAVHLLAKKYAALEKRCQDLEKRCQDLEKRCQDLEMTQRDLPKA
jgi:hypothetical protein